MYRGGGEVRELKEIQKKRALCVHACGPACVLDWFKKVSQERRVFICDSILLLVCPPNFLLFLILALSI